MAKKTVLMKNIPADEVDEMMQTFDALGATGVKKTPNPDGTFNIEGTLPD